MGNYEATEIAKKVPRLVSLDGVFFGIGGKYQMSEGSSFPEGTKEQLAKYAEKYPKSTRGIKAILKVAGENKGKELPENKGKNG